jgi:hypothetical protein
MEERMTGIFDVPKTRKTIRKDQRVFWCPDGDPVTGEPGTGAVSATENEYPMGTAEELAKKDDAFCRVRIPVGWTVEGSPQNLTPV